MTVRVRYAPSPTGYLHIGGARTAVFNYLFAKHNKGKFIVRIEDTDLERNIADGISSQLDNLRWMGLEIDETIDTKSEYGPYQQTERLDIYLKYAQNLIDKGLAYHCFCSSETIDKMREAQAKAKILAFQYDGRCAKLDKATLEQNLKNKKKYAIRVKIPVNQVYEIEDIVRGKVSFHTRDLGDYIIIKSNGVATYNFAVVIDDYLMKITHVFRGEEHLSNTPKQLVIYHHFKWTAPKFGHLTLIINHDGKKLSKRDGSLMQFIHQYRNEGYLPEALFNFITLLGWSSHEEREIYTKEEFIKIFNPAYLSKAPSMFDVQKLLWMNNYYIKKLDNKAYFDLVEPFVKAKYDWKSKPQQWWHELLLIYQRQLMYGSEITDLITLFFHKKFEIDPEAQDFLKANDNSLVIKTFSTKISQLKQWNEEAIKQVINQVKVETKVNGKLLFMPIRIICTGQMHGPELPQTIKLLGQDAILSQIKTIKF